MVSKIVRYQNPLGLQVKQAGDLTKIAMEYKSVIQFSYDGGIANAKSVLSVLGAGIRYGDEMNIICEGEDEEEALRNLVDFVQNNGSGN